jgi:hypothetical protein
VFDILKANFDAAYGGNRAPLPIFIHSPWLRGGNHLEDLQRFADYARAKRDVYFVTIRQLLGWMRNPIPANLLTPAKLGCGNPGGAPATPQQLATGTPPPKSPPPRKSPPPPEPPPPPVPMSVPSPVGGMPRPAGSPALGSPSPVAAPTPPPRGVLAMPPSGIRITLILGGEPSHDPCKAVAR